MSSKVCSFLLICNFFLMVYVLNNSPSHHKIKLPLGSSLGIVTAHHTTILFTQLTSLSLLD